LGAINGPDKLAEHEGRICYETCSAEGYGNFHLGLAWLSWWIRPACRPVWRAPAATEIC